MKNLLVFLTILLPFSVFAQSNYYAGYVIKNSGDTLKGYINYREWSQSPHYIDFKINKDNKTEQHLSPQDIKGFHINDLETYISYTGFISNGRANHSDLHNGIDSVKTMDTLFLKQVATGSNLKLYQERDYLATRFFVAETDGNAVQLNYYMYLNDQRQITKLSLYKGQLILYANKFQPGSSRLNSKIETADYETEDLQNIVNEINGEKSIGRKIQKVRLFAGVGLSNTTTQTDFSTYANAKQNNSYTAPRITAGIDIFGNPTIQQLILRAELSFSYIDARFKGTPVTQYYAINAFSFNQYTVTFTPQLVFNVFNKTRVKIFIDAGVGLNFSAYSNRTLTLAGGTFTLENYWISAPLQVGIVFKKMELGFTYTGYASYTEYDFFYLKSQSTSLGFKYRFGK